MLAEERTGIKLGMARVPAGLEGGVLPILKRVIRVIPAGKPKNGDFFISIALHLKRDTPSKWRDKPTYSEGVDKRIAIGTITQI